MAANPNLIPTVITDKNGKVTKVHKRPEASSAPANAIPAPAMHTDSQRVTIQRQIIECVQGENPYPPGRASFKVRDEAIRKTLGEASDEALRDTHQLLVEHPEASGLVFAALWKRLSSDEVHEIVLFAPRHLDTSYREIIPQVMGLHLYPQLPSSKSFALADTQVQSRCHALLAVVNALYHSDDPNTSGLTWEKNEYDLVPRITNDKVVDYLLENPHHAQVVVNYIEARGCDLDVEVIRAMSVSATALIQGAL